MKNLFGEEVPEPGRKKKRGEVYADYAGFVEKFKTKLTTDDCYTPPLVYEAVRRWVDRNILPLDGVEIVRPFYPGGDYERFDYPDGCLVLDNPPFSILAKIRRFYHRRGIRYFLFAPAMTLFASAKELDATFLVCGARVVYDNGASVPTSFVTNLDCGGARVWCAGSLTKEIETAVKETREWAKAPEPPVYDYPPEVITAARLQKLAKRGIDLRFPKNECVAARRLDSQGEKSKALFGGGFLISERLAAERLAAERLAAHAKFYWPLSERERAIVRSLGNPQND